MNLIARPFQQRQRGAVLVVGLIMLAVMTLFVISMLKTSIIELKIGGASQVAALNFSNAETAIDNFIQLNNGRFAPNFKGLAFGAGGPNLTPVSVQGGTVTFDFEQINCGPAQKYNTTVGVGPLAIFLEGWATATGTLGGTTTIRQGMSIMTAAC